MADTEENDKGKRIVKRYDDGKKNRIAFDQRIDLLAPYVDPTRYGIMNDISGNPGQALMGQVYDGEGIYAANLATNFIGGQIHSPGSKWFSLIDENSEVMRTDEAREWYEECRDRMLKDDASSNFYGEVHETDKDWMVFGCGDFNLEERPVEPDTDSVGYRGARFKHYKAGRFVFYENQSGMVDSRYSEFTLNAFAAKDKFGQSVIDDKMGIRDAIEAGDFNKQFKFIHGIYPRKYEEQKGNYGNKKMPWASCFVEYKTKKIVLEEGYEEFPDMGVRWSRVYGEAYGRGLGEVALNACLTANATVRMKLENLALKIKPPILQAHDAVIGKMRLIPGAPLTVRQRGTGPVSDQLQALNVGGDFQAATFEVEDLRKAIRRYFNVDQLQQLMEMEKQQEMRQFVFAQKLNLTFKVLGPVFGRWQYDFGVPYVRRHFNLMYRRGAFSRPPDILLEQGGRIKVQFESPLARAQRMEEIAALQGAMQDILPIAEAQAKFQGYPTILDKYDFDRFADTVNIAYGVPASITNSDKQIGLIRQSRAAEEQRKQQNSEAMGISEAARNVAPLIKAINPLGQAA